MLLPLLYSIMRKCRSPNSCIGMSAHVFALTSVRFLPQKLQHCALFVSLGFPSAVLMWLIVIPAHSFMQTLSSSLSSLHISKYAPTPVLLLHPPPPLSILSLADSVIHNWYIGGYSLSMPDARRLFSDLSLP